MGPRDFLAGQSSTARRGAVSSVGLPEFFPERGWAARRGAVSSVGLQDFSPLRLVVEQILSNASSWAQ